MVIVLFRVQAVIKINVTREEYDKAISHFSRSRSRRALYIGENTDGLPYHLMPSAVFGLFFITPSVGAFASMTEEENPSTSEAETILDVSIGHKDGASLQFYTTREVYTDILQQLREPPDLVFSYVEGATSCIRKDHQGVPFYLGIHDSRDIAYINAAPRR